MSIDPQNYSIQHQCEKLNEYAAANGMLIVARSRRYYEGRPLRWHVDMTSANNVDFVIAVQLNPENNAPAAYFLFPVALVRLRKVTICEEAPQRVAAYRHADLLFGLARAHA